MIKVAINGFGRIGRTVFKNILSSHPELEVVAINDLVDPKNLSHLLKYDSNYGVYGNSVDSGKDYLLIGGKSGGEKIKVFREKDPENLPWKELEVDVVLECTGFFRDREGASKHLKAGSKKVIISAPAKDENIPSFVLGVNEQELKKEDNIIDMGSCTTNCLAPIVHVLNKEFEILKGFMTTIHSYTSNQKILDAPHKDLRRGRSAGVNFFPTSTGAAQAIGKVIPELKGKLDGIAVRVPTPVVSMIDLVFEVKKETTAEEVNYILKKSSSGKSLSGILGVEDALLVSSDYIGNSYSSIVDAENTRVIENNMVKILSWYDNEYGYSCRLADFASFMGNKFN
jgi:glyceraldehyde 3-phosphate dehydrogenase